MMMADNGIIDWLIVNIDDIDSDFYLLYILIDDNHDVLIESIALN